MPPRRPGFLTARVPIDALLRDLGPQLCRGEVPFDSPGRWPTGIAAVDRILGGGFPRGRLGEITGPASSGRTSLALALLATTTHAGETVAVVDASDAFDPDSATAAGVLLDRVLWVRPPGRHEAFRSSEILLGARGFGLVVLDLGERTEKKAASRSIWIRLSRAATRTQTALVLVGSERIVGSAAELSIEMQPTRSHFVGTPALLEGFEARALLVRNRAGPFGSNAPLRLHASLSKTA